MEWKLIDTAPFDRDLELAVVDTKGAHPVAFPCRRLADNRWIDGFLQRHDARQFLKFNTIPNKVGSEVAIRCAAHQQNVKSRPIRTNYGYPLNL